MRPVTSPAGVPSAPADSAAAPNPAASTPSSAVAIDEEQFAQDLSLMLRSGLRLLEALHTLMEREHGGTQRWLAQLVQALQQGQPLSQAMRSVAPFSAALLACVRASEATGDLGDSLARFAANAARMRVLRSRLVSACVYPAMLISVASLVVLFLLMFVVPRFAVVLESTMQDMPLMSRVLIQVGTTLHAVQGPLLLVLGSAMAWGGWMLFQGLRTQRLAGWAMGTAARLPWLRPYIRSYGLAQLSRSAAMLVRSGVPALKALAMCRELLAVGERHRLDEAVGAATNGAPLARALHDAGLYDALGFRVLKVAEQTGQLDTALDRVADVCDAMLERGLERIGRLIEPVLMLVIGGVVGGIVVLMYLPIFQLAASIK